MGIKNYIILNFNEELASLSAEDFIEIILYKKLKIKNLVVGFDFRFGKNRKGNVTLLQKKSLDYNFSITVLDKIISNQTSEVFSSTLIRNNIRNGNFEKVNSYLGRNWTIHGTVVVGDKKAGKMNFPTANIVPPNLIHPKKGVYVGRTLYDGNTFNGIANFGVRPTVDGKKLLLEVHLFDFNLDLYGKDLTVEFLTFIRDEKKFVNFEKLKQQIHKDIQIARSYLINN